MPIQLKDLKKQKFEDVERKFEYKDLVKLTMKFDGNKGLKSVMSQIQEHGSAQRKLTKDDLRKENNQGEVVSSGEALLFAIGEYAITDWDVLDTNGKPIEPSGDDLITLCASVSDNQAEQMAFMSWVITSFNELASEYGKQRDEADNLAKKPSKRGVTKRKSAS